MSIYRGWKPSSNYRPEPRPTTDPAPPRATPPEQVRKAQPLQSLLPGTAAWITSLPQSSRPIALAQQYARIANNLSATWHQPNECRRYFDELLIDKRGGRKGFPREVLAELLVLRRLHAEQYPTVDIAWQIPTR